MYNGLSASPRITNCTFSENQASASGGGMENSGASLTLVNCTFNKNKAGYAGGGGMSNSASPTLINCTFSENTTSNNGGGMYNSSANPTLINCTFSGNEADKNGDGMYNSFGATPTVTNSIVWNNRNGTSIGGNPAKVTYSIVEGGYEGEGNLGEDLQEHDPLLRPLGNYGGPVQTMPVLVGSPAIGAGATQSEAPSGVTILTTDAIDQYRNTSVACTMGAVEYSTFDASMGVTGGGSFFSSIDNITFAVTGTAPLGAIYQWFKNGIAISGATGATYTTKQSETSASYYCIVTFGSTTKTTDPVAITAWVLLPTGKPTFDVYETKVSARTSVIKEMKVTIEGGTKPVVHYRAPVSKSYTILMTFGFDGIDEVRTDGYAATGHGRIWTAGLKTLSELKGEKLTVSGLGADLGVSPIGAKGLNIPVEFEYYKAEDTSNPWLYFTGLATADWNNNRFASSSGVVYCESMKPIPCATKNCGASEQESESANGNQIANIYYPQPCYEEGTTTHVPAHFYGTYTMRYNAGLSTSLSKKADYKFGDMKEEVNKRVK